jgi:hypothetical protein
VRVLLDHNVPRKLAAFLLDHDVATALDMGWSALENGELLRIAEAAGFTVFVTADQNMSYQQNFADRSLGLVVLSTNNWNVLKQHPAPVALAVGAAIPGSFQRVQV